MSAQQLTLYTIGHSNITVAELARLLLGQQIRVLVDVRSSPYSKFASQFNVEQLKVDPALPACGVRYLFAGKMLGGRPENAVFYDEDGHVLYDEIARSYTFQDGIAKLLDIARKATTAIMCSEEDPRECHRRLLIARVLAEEGVTVLHMRGDGRVQSEEDLQREETAGQLGFGFDELEEETGWKSIRSVLPKVQPNVSSDD